MLTLNLLQNAVSVLSPYETLRCFYALYYWVLSDGLMVFNQNLGNGYIVNKVLYLSSFQNVVQ